ncbi:MAG: histidine kinase, partial [Lachnospiraceae bacterium]|nr:histidine kinase [Lachnospiraceae bacterium]
MSIIRRFIKLSVITLSVLMLMILTYKIEVSAEVSKRDVFGTGADYTSILYDSTNGLPTSEANAIAQDEEGFIWLGGYSGLVRYDGTNFYRFEASTGISSVFSIYVDSKNRVWVGTNENGVALYDHGDIKTYGRVEGVESASIRSMTEDSEGNIIIGTTQGLAYIDAETLKMHAIDDPQINSEYITGLSKDISGNVYGLTSEGALFLLDELRVTVIYDMSRVSNEQINAMYPDPDRTGIIYLGTVESELIIINVNDEDIKIVSKRSVYPHKNINSITKSNSNLWIASTNGIGYLDINDNYNILEELPMNYSIGNVMVDKEGNLWFTSTRQGVMKLVPDRFVDISKLAGLDNRVINTTCVNNKKLYLGTDSGLEILDINNYVSLNNELTKMLEDVRIRCIKNDDKDRVWLCTHGETGLICYEPKDGSIKIYNESNGLDTTKVRAVLPLENGTVVVATGNGMFIISKDGKIKHYGEENGVNAAEILTVEQGPDEKLYLGSDGEGIYVIDESGVSRLGIEEGLTSEVVMRIKWDSVREMFWIITSNSIEYMKDGVITAVTEFPYANNYDIYFDDHGGAWVLASNGIYITKVSELIENDDIQFSFYDLKSGLPYIATGNSRDYLGENGDLYIAGTAGVCKVNINEESEENKDIGIVV